MKNILIQLFFVFLISSSFATEKANIINNLGNINNLSFKFEQNINGNIQNGECIIKYPKKFFSTIIYLIKKYWYQMEAQ